LASHRKGIAVKHWKDQARSRLFALAKQREITPGEFIALVYLSDAADWRTGENAYPGVERIAGECGISEKTVRRAMERGTEHRVIEQTRRGGGAGASARGNTYRFIAHLNTGHHDPEFSTPVTTQDGTSVSTPVRTVTRPRRPKNLGTPTTQRPTVEEQEAKRQRLRNRLREHKNG
jgi:hypothetical protein